MPERVGCMIERRALAPGILNNLSFDCSRTSTDHP
jgi:hypothetical protein